MYPNNKNQSINNSEHNNNIIKQVDVKQNQFNSYKDRMTEPVTYEKNEKKNYSIIWPYIIITTVIVIIIFIAFMIFIGRR